MPDSCQGNNRLRTTGRYWMDLIPFNTFSAWSNGSNGSHYPHCHPREAAISRWRAHSLASICEAQTLSGLLCSTVPQSLDERISSAFGPASVLCNSLLQKTPPSSLFWLMSLHFNVLFNVINSHSKYLSSIKCTSTLQKKDYQLQRDLLCLFKINSYIGYSFLRLNLCLLTYHRHT